MYEHLSKVVLKIITEQPANANDGFEDISAAVRAELTKVSKPPQEEKMADASLPSARDPQLAWVEKQTPLFKPPADDTIPDKADFPDLLDDAATLEWAGISLGSEYTYLLYLSLKSLAVSKNTKVRFWGKVLTMNGDYYVAETTTDKSDLGELQELEVEGVFGPNKYTYYVMKEPGDASVWIQLPHVTPKQIIVCRQLKRFLTGDLNAVVNCYPPLPSFTSAAMPSDGTVEADKAPYHFCKEFAPNTEAHLLRAQIARITSECVLTLTGFVKEPDEKEDEERYPNQIEATEQPEDPADAPKIEEHATLLELDTWIHAELDIGPLGRCQPIPELDEDGGIVPPEDETKAKDPMMSISEDKFPAPDESDAPSQWLVRTTPDGPGKSNNSLVVVRSLKWPGAVAIASTSTSLGMPPVNLYIGYGMPKETPVPVVYTPPMPKKVQVEWPGPPEEDADPDEIPSLVEEPDIIIKPPVEDEED